jgi:hypothetical protein
LEGHNEDGIELYIPMAVASNYLYHDVPTPLMKTAI